MLFLEGICRNSAANFDTKEPFGRGLENGLKMAPRKWKGKDY